MVVLRNIKREKRTISANFYPENRDSCGFIEVEYPSGEVLRFEKAPGWKHCQMAGVHARDELLKLFNAVALPTERKVMWY